MNQPELGKKILELRQKLGLTQSELAENCNLSLRTIQRIESAEVTPRSHTIKVILFYLKYDLSTNLSDDASREDYFLRIRLRQFLKYVLKLFNLKTNTMKKLSALSVIAILIIAGFSLMSNHIYAQKIDGWFLSGSKPNSYEIGLDQSTYKTGGSSAYLKSTDKKIKGFGTLMQSCRADEYLGKRIKMTGYIKSENVSDWAGMWLRVDSSKNKNVLSFNNMEDRPINGNKDWTLCEITLDVPNESGTLNFGVLLTGTGKVWFDNIKFEVVNKLETIPSKEKFINKKPSNLDF